MALPTAAQQQQLVQSLVDHAQTQGVNILGIPLDTATLTAALDMAIAAACMKQWQASKAAGAAAAAAIITEGDAEAAQRSGP